jgi:hypothetical protein
VKLVLLKRKILREDCITITSLILRKQQSLSTYCSLGCHLLVVPTHLPEQTTIFLLPICIQVSDPSTFIIIIFFSLLPRTTTAANN